MEFPTRFAPYLCRGYVIVLFTSFMGMYGGSGFDAGRLVGIPVAIVVGLLIGIILGIALTWFFKKVHARDTVKIIIILNMVFLLVTLGTALKPYIPMSGLLAVMALCCTILKQYDVLAKRLSRFSHRLIVLISAVEYTKINTSTQQFFAYI